MVKPITAPWDKARFYAAWTEYQRGDVYRTRLVIMGFRYAFDLFLGSKVTRDYLLQERLKREPELKWRIRLLPWSIPKPDILDTALASGVIGD